MTAKGVIELVFKANISYLFCNNRYRILIALVFNSAQKGALSPYISAKKVWVCFAKVGTTVLSRMRNTTEAAV